MKISTNLIKAVPLLSLFRFWSFLGNMPHWHKFIVICRLRCYSKPTNNGHNISLWPIKPNSPYHTLVKKFQFRYKTSPLPIIYISHHQFTRLIFWNYRKILIMKTVIRYLYPHTRSFNSTKHNLYISVFLWTSVISTFISTP